MPSTYTYNKPEKLKSRKKLNEIFTKGKSFPVFPVKVFYVIGEANEHSVKTGVGVSTRNFKKAVDRNRIKRLLRECYRLNKTTLHEAVSKKQKSISVFFLYVGKELPDFEMLTGKMKTALTKLEQNLD
ncbi:ribonuclease P protein component [Sediminibacterium roseum]|uniref:Ribonuclease P protein component n=1 Tax=Sediminibacterium roseum TaxID=1978412 RepID=A0ABW9ZU87_9BACT|nr:ribonuclease P protein component [Sediminibacterium roseum]NCI48426.1 ribonuclease P protein component [Sediminibacterium roseum]